MAKTKAQLIEEATSLGIEVDSKAKVAEIQALINDQISKAEETITHNEAESIEAATQDVLEDIPTAKAGKRSAKAINEARERELKEERKKSGEDTETKTKPAAKPARTRSERRGKLFKRSLEKVDKNKSYSLDEAINLAKETSHVKFDATVELHVNLAVDPKYADQNVRDNLVLPNGTGKAVKVAALSDDEAAAKAAGADIFSAQDIFADLDKGVINFDILIASPQQMSKLGKYARILGPRGLMPNPKSGTVSTDINRAVSEAKAGRVEYRVDSTGIVHLGVGKVSFEGNKLKENVEAVFASIKSNKPSSVKGSYIKAVHLTTSMGPSITVDLSALV